MILGACKNERLFDILPEKETERHFFQRRSKVSSFIQKILGIFWKNIRAWICSAKNMQTAEKDAAASAGFAHRESKPCGQAEYFAVKWNY